MIRKLASPAIVVAAGALAFSGVSPAPHSDGTTLIEAPPVQEANDGLPNLADDGRFRLIVTPIHAEANGEQTTGDQDATWRIDPSRTGEVPPDATIVFRDGTAGYVDANGDFIAVDGALPVTADPGDTFAAELLATPDVESVRAIGDGRYAVVTTSQDALADRDVHVVEDLPIALSADPYVGYQWALHNTGANLNGVSAQVPLQVVDADIDGNEVAPVQTGAGVTVAVVDSGVDFSHPDLSGSSWTNVDEVCGDGIDNDTNGFVDDCQGWDFGNEDNRTFDGSNNSHGTHVAGIITASVGNGIGIAGLAPDTLIMDLSVAAGNPAAPTISASSVARAIRYAVDNGADLVNLSLGSAPGAPRESALPIIDAIEYARANDVLLVVAAGNSNVDLSRSAVWPASVESSNMLVVGASTPGDSKASFSNFGAAVDLFTPGELIASTVPGGDYKFMSGTSQAAPLTAAAAALVLERQPDLRPAAVIDQLVGSSDEVAALSGLASSGVRLNAARAAGLNPDSDLITISGLAEASLDEVHADVTIAQGPGQFDQPFHWEVTLIAVRPDASFAIVDHSITVGNDERITDARGAVELARDGAVEASLTTVLPAGTYGLMIEAVPSADSTARLGDAYMATFSVGEPEASEQPSTTQPETVPTDSAAASGAASGGADASSPGPSGTGTTAGGTAGGGGGQVDPANGGGSAQTSTSPANSNANGSTSGATSTSGNTSSAGGQPGGQQNTSPTPNAGNPSAASPTATGAGSSGAGSTSTATSGSAGGGSAGGSGQNTATNGSTGVSFGPVEVANGAWSVDGVAPRFGPVSTSTLVNITGQFPEAAYVWFGTQPGTVVSQTPTAILVLTPRQATPGTVDVSLRTTREGTVLTIPGAFVYQGGDDSSGTGTGTDFAPSPVAGPEVPSESSPGTATPGTSNPGTAAPGTAAPGTAAPGPTPTPQSQARAQLIGEPVDLGNGLRGVRMQGEVLANSISPCKSNPCRTRRI